MADNPEIKVRKVLTRRNGAYYVLNVRSKGGLGVCTVKHTLVGSFVCLTDLVADTRDGGDERNVGCVHTRVAIAHFETLGEPPEGEEWENPAERPGVQRADEIGAVVAAGLLEHLDADPADHEPPL